MKFPDLIASIRSDARTEGRDFALCEIEGLRMVREKFGPPLTAEERGQLTVLEAELRGRR